MKENINKLVKEYQNYEHVEAIVLGGSSLSIKDLFSDLDVYIYTTKDVPIEERANIASKHADYFEINNQYWEIGDEWIEKDTGLHIDITYRKVKWIKDKLDEILVKHTASLGYTTSIWYNVLHSDILYDPHKWFYQLQQNAQQDYPKELSQAIISKNFPVLNKIISSYASQIEKAAKRKDLVSVNHRVAAFLASYFDIIFAINNLPHPGEKQLLVHSGKSCDKLPENMESDITELFSSYYKSIFPILNRIVDRLESLLSQNFL